MPSQPRMRSRRSTQLKKQKSAKHANSNQNTQMLIDQANLSRRSEPPRKPKKYRSAEEESGNQLKDLLASEEDILEMTNAVADYTRISGCSLLEVLYGINECIDEDKRL